MIIYILIVLFILNIILWIWLVKHVKSSNKIDNALKNQIDNIDKQNEILKEKIKKNLNLN